VAQNSAHSPQNASSPKRLPEGIDTTVPNVARIYDYLLDGKDNFAADRQAAHHLVTLVPAVRQSVWENRRFLRRVVRYLVADEGIDQFLDIGVGLPTQGAVHQVAHETNPAARVAYVDYDPVVVLHGNALLTEADRSVVVKADVRQPGAILGDPVISAHLDFSRPVAVTLLAVMHFISDEDDPYGIVAALRDALAPGSFLVLGHVSRDNVPADLAERVIKMYEQASEPLTPRSKDQVTRFFDGFKLVDPGITHENDWRPDADSPRINQANLGWAGVGRIP
jgi:SAM-dependent methyltransferase